MSGLLLPFLTLVGGVLLGCFAIFTGLYRPCRILFSEKSNDYEELKGNYEDLYRKLRDTEQDNQRLSTNLDHEKTKTAEKIALLEQAKASFEDTFKALSADALSRSNKEFLALAKENLEKVHESTKGEIKASEKTFSNLVNPVKEALGEVSKRLEDMEKARVGAYEGIQEQVKGLLLSQKDLKSETTRLVQALRTPNIRGRWGEMQLKRVLEMSGMSGHCDFIEQVNIQGEDGRLRPDMIVNLPNNKTIIIDAKAPLSAYLDALEAPDELQKTTFLKDHARQVRAHVTQLSSRAYWNQFQEKETPEFVVLFLPGETFFTAALEHDPGLIEDGVQKNVIIATPATLIALLHAIAYGWRQESLAENARDISNLGQELYKRVSDMGGHIVRLGSQLGRAVESYNDTVGSLEARVLPTARKFKELRAAAGNGVIEPVLPLDKRPRPLQAAEFLAPESLPDSSQTRK